MFKLMFLAGLVLALGCSLFTAPADDVITITNVTPGMPTTQVDFTLGSQAAVTAELARPDGQKISWTVPFCHTGSNTLTLTTTGPGQYALVLHALANNSSRHELGTDSQVFTVVQ